MGREVPEGVLKKECWTAICAFLNADGGDLLIGVADDATVLGLEADLARAGGLDALVRHVEAVFGDKLRPNPLGLVRIEPVEVEGRTVLRVRVTGDRSKRYELDGDIYVRRNAASKPKLTPGESADWWRARERPGS